MNNTTTSLYRPDKGRWIAGVAAGLSLRFGVAVWPIRIVFALLCFASGLGTLLYVAGWLWMPRQGETEGILPGWLNAGPARRRIGVILVGIVILVLASATGFIRGDLAGALALVGIGTLFYHGYLSRRDCPPATAPVPPKRRSHSARVYVGVAAITLGVLSLFHIATVGIHPEPHHYGTLAAGVIGFCFRIRSGARHEESSSPSSPIATDGGDPSRCSTGESLQTSS